MCRTALSRRRDVSDLSSFRGAEKCERPAIFSRFRVESLPSACVELRRHGGTRCDRDSYLHGRPSGARRACRDSRPVISLSPEYLLIYAAFSISRMFAAYLLSILFTLLYGCFAANHNRAGQVMMPLLDVLQSVPILSFLPVVLLGLTHFSRRV